MRARYITLTLALALAGAACSPPPGDARSLARTRRSTPALLDAPDRFFTTNGVTIRYRVIGDGEPVLLIHGYTDRVEMWSGPADSLARDFRVIAPDLRGFGLSTKFDDPRQYGRTMVADMVALLDHLGVRATHVVGYSMGGVIAAHLALDDPARVRTATFVAGAFSPDSASAMRAYGAQIDSLARGHGIGPFFRWILPTWSDSAVEAALPSLNAINDSASLVASLQALPGLAIAPARLAQARVPAVAVVSQKDRVLENSRFIARHWPGLRLVELGTHDHADIFLAPELVTEFRKLAAAAPTTR